MVEIPGSISNPAVKHHIGNDTTPYWGWKSSSLPGVSSFILNLLLFKSVVLVLLLFVGVLYLEYICFLHLKAYNSRQKLDE